MTLLLPHHWHLGIDRTPHQQGRRLGIIHTKKKTCTALAVMYAKINKTTQLNNTKRKKKDFDDSPSISELFSKQNRL